MALQINTGLTTADGGTVESGSYVIFTTTFPARGFSYTVEMFIYRSLTALNNGLQPIKTVEIEQPFYVKQLTQQEYESLTPITVHEDAKAYLEQFVGVGNVQIII